MKKRARFVTSDRFLGEDRQIKLVGSPRKFPYVIIMDTAGCNLRCWFCYSHHFWKPEESCTPVFLSTDEIISQLRCKLDKILEAKGKMDVKPFTSIRISGGEPIYANPTTLTPYQSDKPIDYKLGIDFWLDHLEKLDSLIGELNKQGSINIVPEEEWDINRTWPWPTFVSDAKDRVYLRFDTNGIAFGDNDEAKRVHGGRENVDHFISGLYNLHKAGKLGNLKIWITYSFKGACPQRILLVTTPQPPHNRGKRKLRCPTGEPPSDIRLSKPQTENRPINPTRPSLQPKRKHNRREGNKPRPRTQHLHVQPTSLQLAIL